MIRLATRADYGFPPELYDIRFESSGDSALARQIVALLADAAIPARTSPLTEARGKDGSGQHKPGFDHGVFVPFKLMFEGVAPVPVVQVSIDASLDPALEWALGAALSPLREQQILIIAGGLT